MTKTQVYLPQEQLDALHRVARQRRKSVAALIREAIGVALGTEPRGLAGSLPGRGPVALWSGTPRRTSVDHDAIYDEP